MRNYFSAALAGLGLLGAMIAVPAASAGETDDIWEAHRPYFCRSDQPMQNKFYFSRVERSDTTVIRQEVEKSFRAFMAKNFAYPNTAGVSCTARQLASPDPMEAYRQQTIDNLHSAHFDVAETDWTYTPGATAPARPGSAPAASAAPVRPSKSVTATPAPSKPAQTTTPHNAPSQPGAVVAAGAAAPPTSLYGVCYASYDPHAAYFSAPFRVTNGNSSAWVQAFATFLQQKYHYGQAVGCVRMGSLADAQSYLKKLDDSFRPTRKIIETGWQYQ